MAGGTTQVSLATACTLVSDKVKTGETNILVVRLAYSHSIVLIVLIMFVLKPLIKPMCKVRILIPESLMCDPDTALEFVIG